MNHDPSSPLMSATADPRVQYALLITVAVIISAGQVLFKVASAPFAQGLGWRAVIFSPALLSALVLYGLGTALWIAVLARVDLSRAYPFAALSFVLVPLLSHFLLGERIGPAYLAGVAFLAVGVVLCQL